MSSHVPQQKSHIHFDGPCAPTSHMASSAHSYSIQLTLWQCGTTTAPSLLASARCLEEKKTSARADYRFKRKSPNGLGGSLPACLLLYLPSFLPVHRVFSLSTTSIHVPSREGTFYLLFTTVPVTTLPQRVLGRFAFYSSACHHVNRLAYCYTCPLGQY